MTPSTGSRAPNGSLREDGTYRDAWNVCRSLAKRLANKTYRSARRVTRDQYFKVSCFEGPRLNSKD
jgi:hypothetical protein